MKLLKALLLGVFAVSVAVVTAREVDEDGELDLASALLYPDVSATVALCLLSSLP